VLDLTRTFQRRQKAVYQVVPCRHLGELVHVPTWVNRTVVARRSLSTGITHQNCRHRQAGRRWPVTIAFGKARTTHYDQFASFQARARRWVKRRHSTCKNAEGRIETRTKFSRNSASTCFAVAFSSFQQASAALLIPRILATASGRLRSQDFSHHVSPPTAKYRLTVTETARHVPQSKITTIGNSSAV